MICRILEKKFRKKTSTKKDFVAEKPELIYRGKIY
jgi:hypothetical protein